MSSPADTPDTILPGDVTALILAAGEGTRFGRSKAFLSAGGSTLLERAVAAVQPFAAQVIAGVRADDVAKAEALVGATAAVVAGGETRQQTLEILFDLATRPIVLLHEVARPMVTPEQFSRVLGAAAAHGAACPCVAASRRDSVAIASGEFIGQELSRDSVVYTQIPQAFRHEILSDTLGKARENSWRATSVVSLCVRAGHRVHIVAGEHENVKVTFAEDWEAVRRQLVG